MKKLSIVILSYNTRELLRNCLKSIWKHKDEADLEIIVSDNGSKDGSDEIVKEEFPEVILIENKKNLGFAAGNNKAKDLVKGQYVLILNSDTEIRKSTLKETIRYLDEHQAIGALTCKVVLPSGKLDADARRSFPTPLVAFSHFSGMDRVFPNSKLFARYWYNYLPEDLTHDVDVVQGAFTLVRKKVIDEVGWYDESYFLDGEDIDLCWKIKKAGYKIVYYPKVSILHIKGASKGKKHSFGKVTKQERVKFINAGVDSMEIFYKKRLWDKYPLAINLGVILSIRTLKSLRYIKALLS